MKFPLPLRAQQTLQSLGWPGWVGVLGLLLAAGALLLAQGWDAQTSQLQAQADGLRSQLRKAQTLGVTMAVATAPVTPTQWLQALPAAALRQQRLADLLEIGLRQGLVSARTEHRLSVDSAAGLERLRVSMPLNGGYAQLRGFIETALRQDPALSLDSLKLRRATPLAAELEAELVWSLHGRADQTELRLSGAPP